MSNWPPLFLLSTTQVTFVRCVALRTCAGACPCNGSSTSGRDEDEPKSNYALNFRRQSQGCPPIDPASNLCAACQSQPGRLSEDTLNLALASTTHRRGRKISPTTTTHLLARTCLPNKCLRERERGPQVNRIRAESCQVAEVSASMGN